MGIGSCGRGHAPGSSSVTLPPALPSELCPCRKECPGCWPRLLRGSWAFRPIPFTCRSYGSMPSPGRPRLEARDAFSVAGSLGDSPGPRMPGDSPRTPRSRPHFVLANRAPSLLSRRPLGSLPGRSIRFRRPNRTAGRPGPVPGRKQSWGHATGRRDRSRRAGGSAQRRSLAIVRQLECLPLNGGRRCRPTSVSS